MQFNLRINYSLFSTGLSVLNPSRIQLNCGVVVLPSYNLSADTVTVEAKENVSVSCVADVILELEMMS